MAIAPYPLQQPVTVVALTTSGFLSGIIHLPVTKNLRTLLNAPDEILKLTEAVLPGSAQVHPFLALQKSATLLVIPKSDPGLPKPETTARRLVTCLLSMGSIRGYIDVPESLRTSDFLLHSPGFIEFRECFLGPNPHVDPKETSGEAFPLVLVNSRSMVGVTEETLETAETEVQPTIAGRMGLRGAS